MYLRFIVDQKDVDSERSKTYSTATKKRGISWFKPAAIEHVAKVRAMAVILERYGIHVSMIRSARVGYVVYEDQLQIVAEPFAEQDC